MTDEPGQADTPQTAEVDADLKTQLIAKADKLGVKIDKRWSVERIEQTLADAAMVETPAPAKPQVSPPSDPQPAQVVVAATAEPVILDGVKCRVTKAGDQKIFTGKADPLHYRWNEMIVLPRSVAEQLELRNFVEIGEP